jgi:hypothetical protein
MAKAGLPEPQAPAVKWNTPRYNACERGHRHRADHTSPSQPSGRWATRSDRVQGAEWGAYVALDTFSIKETRDRLRGASPMATEPP